MTQTQNAPVQVEQKLMDFLFMEGYSSTAFMRSVSRDLPNAPKSVAGSDFYHASLEFPMREFMKQFGYDWTKFGISRI